MACMWGGGHTLLYFSFVLLFIFSGRERTAGAEFKKTVVHTYSLSYKHVLSFFCSETSGIFIKLNAWLKLTVTLSYE